MRQNESIVMGGGLTGLSAGYVLTKAGFRVKLFEGDFTVGGISKTIIHNGFRFDLGGHRFFTKNKEIDNFVRNLMDRELISVPRKSKIYMHNKYFDYPLKPFNAAFGLGIPTTVKIITDYIVEQIKRLIKKNRQISLEDWVVSNFGRTMFNIYFKEYSEKVWGIDCNRISADWVAQRIRGLSLAKAVRNAFLKFSGKDIPSLADRFLYPKLGIGRISDRLKEEIEKQNTVFTGASVERINHSDFKIESIEVTGTNTAGIIYGEEFISTIPLTKLIKALSPPPPQNILNAAARLKFRDIVIVAVMLNRKRITDLTWIYMPEQNILFGRIHEPTNWSEKMAPDGKTIIVMEFFSFKGDKTWNESNERLVDVTVKNLVSLGFINRAEVIDSIVVRVPAAYPLFEIGYMDTCSEIYDYISRFKNLHIAGRTGMFKYYNMDHAIESGIKTAEKIVKNSKLINSIF